MNRRNFVVGLGTVATLSGVASVTAASFADSVEPTTNFQVVALEGDLVVRRLQADVDYDSLSEENDSWNESSIDDLGNVTREDNQNNSVVAYVNDQTNDELEAQLAFEAKNETYEEYTVDDSLDDGGYGFFEIANLGETDEEDVGIIFNYDSDNVGEGEMFEEADVADMFTFVANDDEGDETVISPDSSDPNQPAGGVPIKAGEILTVGLEINLTEDQVTTIQDDAGSSPFGGGLENYSFQLLENIEVGVEFNADA
ncbi:MAG: hypothetical protein ACOC0Z_02085 [Halohasta sp.]